MAPADSRPGSTSDRQRWFATTHWSVVLAAGEITSPRSQEALEELCRMYWYTIYAYLRRGGKSPADAEDLTQSFLFHLCQRNRLRGVEQGKGKFRSFLLVALKNFLMDETAKAHAQKRGGGRSLLSLDEVSAEDRYALEPPDLLDPQKIFERRWALTLLERTLSRLKTEFDSPEKRERFELLRGHLLGDPPPETYADVGRRLGLSEGGVKSIVARMRQRYRELFREEISHTVGNEEEIEAETRQVFAILSR